MELLLQKEWHTCKDAGPLEVISPRPGCSSPHSLMVAKAQVLRFQTSRIVFGLTPYRRANGVLSPLVAGSFFMVDLKDVRDDILSIYISIACCSLSIAAIRLVWKSDNNLENIKRKRETVPVFRSHIRTLNFPMQIMLMTISLKPPNVATPNTKLKYFTVSRRIDLNFFLDFVTFC